MARESLIRCRVAEETKTSLQALAALKGLTESAVVRQLIETVVGVASPAAAVGSPYREPRGSRLYIRLRSEDRILLADRAARRGLPAATYVSVLVRSHLRHLSPVPKGRACRPKAFRSGARGYRTDVEPDCPGDDPGRQERGSGARGSSGDAQGCRGSQRSREGADQGQPDQLGAGRCRRH